MSTIKVGRKDWGDHCQTCQWFAQTPVGPECRSNACPLGKVKVRACSIQNRVHPEWGTWGVMEDRNGYFEIHGRAGGRVLDKSEFLAQWEVV